MATVSPSTKKMPLPVELFSSAMERQLPLTDYARNIDLHPDILRQTLAGRFTDADSDPLNALAKAVNRDPEQLDLTILPCDQSFDIWLKRNMEGITQHGLRARAQLDRQTLKRFLNGDLLPDSDQAERISRALYIDRLEVAHVVTANMAAASPPTASRESPEAAASDRQSKLTSGLDSVETAGQSVTDIRRRRARPQQTSAEPATLISTVAPTMIDETASTIVERAAAATEDSAKGKQRSNQAPKPRTQRAIATVAAMTTHRPHDEHSYLPAIELQQGDRDDGPVAAPQVPLDDRKLEPATQSTRPSKARSHREPNQAAPSSPSDLVDASANIENEEQPAMKEHAASHPPVPAADQADNLVPPAPAKKITEKEDRARRPKRSAARGPANITIVEQMAASTETQTAADDMPVQEVMAEGNSSTQVSLRRRSRTIEPPSTDMSTSRAIPSSLTAEIGTSKFDKRSADISTDRTVPIVTAELAADTASLQLSADEVRLLRHWRQLHPHGRRATLQYIGSLLVED